MTTLDDAINNHLRHLNEASYQALELVRSENADQLPERQIQQEHSEAMAAAETVMLRIKDRLQKSENAAADMWPPPEIHRVPVADPNLAPREQLNQAIESANRTLQQLDRLDDLRRAQQEREREKTAQSVVRISRAHRMAFFAPLVVGLAVAWTLPRLANPIPVGTICLVLIVAAPIVRYAAKRARPLPPAPDKSDPPTDIKSPFIWMLIAAVAMMALANPGGFFLAVGWIIGIALVLWFLIAFFLG